MIRQNSLSLRLEAGSNRVRSRSFPLQHVRLQLPCERRARWLCSTCMERAYVFVPETGKVNNMKTGLPSRWNSNLQRTFAFRG